MELSEEQTAAVRQWIGEGRSLAEVQKTLEESYGLRITYMDLRFLVDDLQLDLKSEGPHFDNPKVTASPASASAPGRVQVRLDKVARPDALVSGSVTFSDGVAAQWHLDQLGRLALNPKDPGYQPSPQDLQDFQTELRNAVEKSGLF